MNIHISDEWDPRARGLALGSVHAEAVRNTVEVYRRLGCDLSAGGRVRVSDDEHEEIFGIALGAGVDGRELLAVNACTELSGAWHRDLADSTLVWVVRDGERWFATLTEAGILARVGMNESGVGVWLNPLACSAAGGLAGSPIHILMRRVLTTCTTVHEAVELLSHARVCASATITVTQGGEATTVALSPLGAQPCTAPHVEIDLAALLSSASV